MSDIVHRYIVEVPGHAAISPLSIEEARYRFKRELAHEPESIVVAPADRMNLLQHPLSKYETLLPDRFMGMKIVVDTHLKEGEWRVAREESRTDAIAE